MKSVDILASKQSIKPSQPSKRVKFIKLVAIILSILVVLTVIFLLVAKYKYNFFKKETYKVAEIRRDLNSIEYFNETKTMKSKLASTDGQIQQSEQTTETKFVVMIMDRLNLRNDDYLSTAGLIVLDSKVKMEGKEANLDSLNIFDEEVMKKFEENQDGQNYPIAIFHFYKNGTLKDIQLPLNSSKNDIQNMEDLINNIVPKLVRNKSEDEDNGIEITKRENNKKKSFTEYSPQKEYVDKYTKTRIKGSKITKKVERDIQGEKLTEIRANTNLFLETQKEENETYLDFGIENFDFNISSNITAIEVEENKNDKDLIKKVFSRQSLQNSEELMKLILDKENQEQEEQNKIILEESEDNSETENKLRNLDSYNGEFGFDWTIVEFNVLGIGMKAVYFVGLSGGKAKNQIIFQSGTIVVPLGNTQGKTSNGNGKFNGGDLLLAKIPIPVLPVSICFKLGAELSFDVFFYNDYLYLKLAGSIYAKAALELGTNLAKVEAGVKGTLLGLDFTTEIQKNWDGRYSKRYIRLEANAGSVELYAEGYVLWWKVLDFKTLIWKGWSNTWYW